MIEWLALMLLAAAPGQRPSAPPGCQLTASREGLLVTVGRYETTLAFDEREAALIIGEGFVRPTVLVSRSGAVFAAIAEDWGGVHKPVGLGRLYAVTCGRDPTITRAVEAPGVDFGHALTLPDGRWVVGGWGGLRIFDPESKRMTPLTSPPPFSAPCWTATDEHPAPAADVPDGAGEVLASGDEVRFSRGGACGYEGEMELRTHALDLGRGTVRRRVAIETVALDGERVLVADPDGPCRKESAGMMWTSKDGGRFALERVVSDSAATGIAALVPLVRAAGGSPTWIALTARCGTRGGELFASPDLQQWHRAVGLSAQLGEGFGVMTVHVANGRAYASSGEKKGVLSWWTSTDGETWTPGPKRVLPPVIPQTLAPTLGVERINGIAEGPSASWAWTNDGLFRKPKDSGTWTRVFP